MEILKEIKYCIDNYFTHDEAVQHLVSKLPSRNYHFKQVKRAERMLMGEGVWFPYALTKMVIDGEAEMRKRYLQDLSIAP